MTNSSTQKLSTRRGRPNREEVGRGTGRPNKKSEWLCEIWWEKNSCIRVILSLHAISGATMVALFTSHLQRCHRKIRSKLLVLHLRVTHQSLAISTREDTHYKSPQFIRTPTNRPTSMNKRTAVNKFGCVRFHSSSAPPAKGPNQPEELPTPANQVGGTVWQSVLSGVAAAAILPAAVRTAGSHHQLVLTVRHGITK